MAAAKGLTSALLAARDEGLSYAQIGARFGITKQSAHERVARALKVAQKVDAKASAFQRVVDLRRAGKTTKQICRELDLRYGVVAAHIAAAIGSGLIEKRSQKNPEREAKVLALRARGLTRGEIAVELGLDRKTIDRVVSTAIENGRAEPLPTERLRSHVPAKTPKPAEVIDIPAFLKPRKETGYQDDINATPEKMVEIVRRIVDGLPEELRKALAGENQGHRIRVWSAPYGYGWWVGINDRRFNASRRYIGLFGFEEAFRTILTRETILPPETIAHDKRSFESEVVTHTLPPGYTADIDPERMASSDDVVAIIERPASVEVKPRPAPAPNPAYVAELIARHGISAACERWPFLSLAEISELAVAGKRMVAPPADEPTQPLNVRVWRAVKRLFGRS